jgi:hypothetical protein
MRFMLRLSRSLSLLPGRFAICRFAADATLPAALFESPALLISATRTAHELSLVCAEEAVPDTADRVETGWRAFALEGPVPFNEPGVIAGLTAPLAAAGVPVFVISTYDTDLLLVRETDLERAIAELKTVAEIRPSP